MGCSMIANADVIRFTRIDGCGRPVCGDDSGIAFDCFAKLSWEANIEEGEDVEYKAANGRVCGYKKGCPSFRGYNIELEFFSVSPELVEIATGGPVVYGWDGKPVGFDDCSLRCKSGFALELWAEVLQEEDACKPDVKGDGAWLYFLMPWISNGILGDLEVGSEAASFKLTGNTRAGGGWGVGPYDVVAQDEDGTPGPMLSPLDASCHRRIQIVTVSPPDPDCEYIPVRGAFCESSS